MKKTIVVFMVAMLMGSMAANAQTGTGLKGDAILGVWTNPDKDARFEIFKTGNQYFGKIIWGTGRDTKDTKNPDVSLRNRELIGLTILNNFIFDGKKTWMDGTIYDPKDGKTYSCKLTLTSSEIMEVRGYVGITLFGRTEKWTRVKTGK